MGISSGVMRIQYLALTIFSVRGGIEQVSKNWLYALNRFFKSDKLKVSALYDNSSDVKYIDDDKFKAYSGNKIQFIIKSVLYGIKSDVNIFSHIHLSIIAVLIRLLNRKTKIIFQLHGIEVWRDLSYIQKLALRITDQIICVSDYTKSVVLNKYSDLSDKIIVLNNSLDPYNESGFNSEYRLNFRKQLGLTEDDKLLISVGRLNSSEGYKGYDKIIEAISSLEFKNISYHIIGKYDQDEYDRVSSLIIQNKLQDKVKLIGYIDDSTLESYFNAADIFVMPSKGEGFGIVFIEAMSRGLRVLAGNVDGSVDAVNKFPESKLVNPESISEIKLVLIEMLAENFSNEERVKLSKKCIDIFNHKNFSDQIINLLK